MHILRRRQMPCSFNPKIASLLAGLCLWMACIFSASASSTIFGGGPFYTGGTATMNALRASGYTTVMLWTIHVNSDRNGLHLFRIRFLHDFRRRSFLHRRHGHDERVARIRLHHGDALDDSCEFRSEWLASFPHPLPPRFSAAVLFTPAARPR